MAKLAWRQDLEAQLQSRNDTQTLPYVGVFESYLSLWREYLRAQAQASELRNQMLIVQHEAQEAITAGDTSSGVQRLTQKLATVQEELKQRYKDTAQDMQEKFTLMKRIQELEKIVVELNATCSSQAQMVQSYEQIELERSHEMNRIESGHQAMTNEIESLRTRAAASEKRISELERENNELLMRILQEKAKSVEEMNKMNAMLEDCRNRSSSGWFSRPKSRSSTDATEEDAKLALNSNDEADADSIGAHWPMSDVAPPTLALHRLQCHSVEVNDVVITRSGKLFATAGADNLVKLWDSGTGRLKSEFRGSNEPVGSVDICGELVLGASNDRTCRVWNSRTARVTQVLTGHANKINGAKFIGSDGHQVLTGSADRTMKVWNVQTNPAKCIQTMRSTSVINALDAASDGQSGVSGHQDGGVRFWDFRTGERVHQITQLHDAHVTSVSFSPKEFQLLSASRDNSLKIVDTRTFQPLHTLTHTGFRMSSNFARVSYSPDASMVAAGSGGGEVVIWDIIGGDVVSQLREHEAPVLACSWGPKKQLVSCDKNGIVVVWN